MKKCTNLAFDRSAQKFVENNMDDKYRNKLLQYNVCCSYHFKCSR